VLDSQADVDAWGDCDHLNGVLTIAGSDIHDLTPLSNLTYVSVLVIRNNPMLESLNGLQNLTGLLNSGIEFTIKYNPLLTSLEPLGNISVSSLGKVEITHNGNLASLKGLEGFKSADWLEIKYNHKLQNLEGLEGLNHTGTLFIISNNDGLTSLDGLSSYGYCTNLIVTDNPNLESLQGLQKLQKASGDLKIENMPKLTNLAGLESLNQVLRLYIRGNSSLADCCGIYPYLGKVSPYSGSYLNLYINNNLPGCNSKVEVATSCIKCDEDIFLYSQTQVDSFPGCENVDGNITIVGASIKDLSALSSLKTVSGTLTITSCLNLTNLDGLENLEDVGDLKIYYNQDLEACCSLVKLLETDTNLVSFISSNSPTCSGAVNLLNNCPPLVEFVDLEISLSNPPSTPIYTSYAMELMVTNTGNQTATGVEIKFAKPTTGVTYLGGNEYVATQGSFNPYNGEVWYVGDVLPNDTQTIQVNYYLLQDSIPISYAQVVALNEDDIDSSPNNGTPPSVNEDDEASTAPPTNGPIICAGSVILESQAEVDAFQGCEIIEGQLTIRSPFGTNGASSDITDLTPLLSITKVTGVIVIQNNDSLINLTGLDNITASNGIVVQSCENINSIQALSGISGEVNVIKISGNPSLTNIDGLEGITKTHNTAEIDNNSTLQNLNGLSGLVEVNDVHLFIHTNPLLTDIQGLSNLTHINTDLIIGNCDGLENLNGLHNLVYAMSFILAGNDALTDVSAVTSLTDVDITFFVANNPLLSDCCIFSDLLNNNNIVSITIENNAPGCNSEQDIESSCGPKICTGDVILESQAEVDAFQGCEIIEGDLIIRSPFGVNGASSDITDLSPLYSLTEVTGSLILENNDQLFNLTGFENITETGTLVIRNCDNLSNIQALTGLAGEIGGSIIFWDNPALPNLNGLNGITESNGTISLIRNSALQNLDGLSNLGYVKLDLEISENVALTNIQGLNQLDSVGHQLLIAHCTLLQNLNGLNNITSVNSLVLAGNDVLQDVSGLNALTNIDNSIYVANNTLLSDCCIFDDLLKSNTISGPITIENNAPGCNSEQDIESSCGPAICTGDLIFESQAEVDAFPGCEIIEGQLVIEGGDISDLTPLSSLKEIRKVLVIRNSSNLLTLNGLNNLTTIGGLAVVNNPLLQNLLPLSNVSSDDLSTLYFQKNKAMIDLKGLEGITGVQNLNIRENDNLTTLEGLNNLATGKSDFSISYNPALENLNGLNSLHTTKDVTGIHNNDALADISALSQLNSVFVLAINSNPSLTNLSGLENLSDVWTIAITGNDALENLDAFSSLTAITGDLTIIDNPALSDCCGIQPLLNGGSIAGNILIENNPFACGSGFDIINNCGPSGVDLELSMSQPNAAPAQWTTYPVTLTLSNKGDSPATGIVVHFPKPDGVVYAGGNEFSTSQGTFNPFGNQEWVVGKLKAGGTVTLQVNYFLLQSDAPVAYAQVSAVNEEDIDSSPNNGTPPSVNEDDEANSVAPSVSSACSGDIVLKSQAEVNAFGNCEIIDGNLMIVGDDIIDLTPLSSIKEVKGNLNIWNNGNLTNLEGLNNLFSVGGLTLRSNPHLENLLPLSNLSGDKLAHLVISKNKELLDLKGLEGITGLEQLFIEGNTYLTTLEGLDNLVVAEGNITIWRNSSLLNLNALANLQSVGAAFTIEQNDKLSDLSALANLGPCRDLHVLTNASLLDLSGLENISGLRDLTIAQNNGLKNLDAFSSLTSISGELTVRGNPALTDCCGIQPLLSSGNIGGPINIYFNPFSCNNEQNILDNCTATVCTGDVQMFSQAEVDAFQGCDIIEGILLINGDDIIDLTPLSTIKEVTGNLYIYNNSSLTSLNGLNNLKKIGGLTISSNPLLESLIPLGNIQGDNLQSLDIYLNPSLIDLQGLEGIKCTNDFTTVQNNTNLQSLQGLDNLRIVRDQFTVLHNPLLTNLNGLENLDSVYFNLIIEDNYSLNDVSALNNLRYGKYISIGSNPHLETIQGFENIFDLKSLKISNNSSLSNLDAFSGLISLNQISILNNPLLADCCIFSDLLNSNAISGPIDIQNNAPGCNSEQDIESSCGPVICIGDVILESQAEVDAFQGCEIIEGDLVIRPPNGVAGASSDITDLSALAGVVEITGALLFENNDLLFDLQGLNALTSVGGGLAIVECANLTSIEALSGISGEIGNISILGNASLINLDGLEGINKVKRNLSVENNDALQNLNGLSNVDSVSTLGNFFPLYIFKNPSLVNIQGLQGLEYVGGLMTIVGCDTLENLNGLENLNTVGGPFVLAENYQLYDASALGNLSSVGGSLTVSGNPLLSDCCIFTDLINNNGINGSIDIQSNAPGCNSEQDIESSCGPVTCTGDVILESQAEVDAFQGCEVIEGDLIIRSPFGSTGTSSDIFDLSPLLSLTEINGTLILENNDHLHHLHGLENVLSVNSLHILECDSLSDIQALSGISGEMEVIRFYNNASIQNLDGLSGITTVSNYFGMEGNNKLQNLNGLSSLTTVGSSFGSVFALADNPSLTDIQGLNNLKSTYSFFVIDNCDALLNLKGLENLTSVGEFILIDNEQVQDIGALTSLTKSDEGITVKNNPMLSDCCIFYDLISSNNSNLYAEIENNAGLCNSSSDILNNCISNGIDLELSMTTTNLNPAVYTSSPVTLTLSNMGTETATGVIVSFPKPDGTVYTGGNEWTATQGTFNPFTNEEWTVGELPAGGSVTLTVSYFLLTANTLSPYAQVTAQNETDSDSSPGNGTPPTVNEDDEATILLNGFTGNGGGISLKNHNERFRLIFDNIFPNPAKYLITMDIFSRFDQTVLLDFYDVTGRSIHRMEVILEEGQNKVELDVSEWRSGTYNVIGRGDGLPAYGRFLKIWEE
jgi:hypothetical protein